MRPQFSSIFRNRRFTVVALGLIGLLVVGLVSVAGVALYNKLQGAPEPIPTATIIHQPTQTRAPSATSVPTARPTTTLVSVASPTAAGAATTAPTGATTKLAPTATPTATDGVPNTGGSMLEFVLAGSGFAALLVLARSGRRRA